MTNDFSPEKKTNKISPENNINRSSGFALMIALGLMSFALIVILGLSTLVQLNSNISSSGKNLTAAKQNALFALNLAIGDLQNEMGPDQRISATASVLDEFPETEAIDGVNNPYWTGAWNSSDPLEGNVVNQVISKYRSSSDGKPSYFRRWLVSTSLNDSNLSAEERIEYAKNFSSSSKDATLIVGPGSIGEDSKEDDFVYVPRQVIQKKVENAEFQLTKPQLEMHCICNDCK